MNPAGLGHWGRASVFFDAAVGDPGANGRLRQVTAGFETGGLSFGYQRDLFDGGVHGHTYRAALAGGSANLTAGVAVALYRGGTRGSGWDAGVVYRLGPAAVGAVLTNIRQPVVRGALQRATLVPSVTLSPGRLISVSAEGRITSDSALGYAAGARLGTPGHPSIGVLVRIETDRSLRRTGWTFGFSIGSRDLLGVIASTAGTASRIGTADLYGVSTRTAGR